MITANARGAAVSQRVDTVSMSEDRCKEQFTLPPAPTGNIRHPCRRSSAVLAGLFIGGVAFNSTRSAAGQYGHSTK